MGYIRESNFFFTISTYDTDSHRICSILPHIQFVSAISLSRMQMSASEDIGQSHTVICARE